MQTKEEILDIIKELKKDIPSYITIPAASLEEEKEMDEKGILGAFLLKDGKYKDTTIILRRVEFLGPKIEIDYSAVDEEKRNVESDELNTVVGNLINYFLALEALKQFDNKEEE